MDYEREGEGESSDDKTMRLVLFFTVSRVG